MKKSKIIAVLALIAAGALLVFILLKSDKPEVKKTTPATAALTVSDTTVNEAKWQEIIKASGPIAPWQEAIIGAEISGQRLIEVTADVGDNVKKGDILAKYNSETLLAEYAELKANWVAAASNQKRALGLKGSGAISDQAVENAVNQAAVAKAQMDAKALQIKYADIIAPDDGVISARNATLGAVGTTGEELFRLIRQNKLEWRGELTPDQSARIVQNQSVLLTLPDGNKVEGTIRQIAPSFNTETRMATIYVDINSVGTAKAGMYAEGQIMLGEQTILIVPAKSVIIRDGHNYVFSIDKSSSNVTVTQREVIMGQTQGDKAEIKSGLSKGEHIVLQGAGFLNDGDIVRISDQNGDQ